MAAKRQKSKKKVSKRNHVKPQDDAGKKDTITSIKSAVDYIKNIVALLSALFISAGFVAEKSYLALLGLRLELGTSLVELKVSGVGFFVSLISLLPSLLFFLVPPIVVISIAFSFFPLFNKRANKTKSTMKFDAFMDKSYPLIIIQVLALFFLLYFSLSSFPELIPFADLLAGKGLISANLDMIKNGDENYNQIVLIVLSSILFSIALERWRRRISRSRKNPNALVLAILIYSIVFIETFLLLPISYGTLMIPTEREHEVFTVKFTDQVVYDELKFKTLKLIRLSDSEYKFFCPVAPQKILNLKKGDLSLKSVRRETMINLLAEFRDMGDTCEIM